MEDALLLHVCECERCLTAAISKRGRLSDHGCEAYGEMLERLKLSAAIQNSIANSEGHLNEQVVEDYCFRRLPPSNQASVEVHLKSCNQCSEAVREQNEFITCMKGALRGWQRGTPAADARSVATLSPADVPRPRFSAEDVATARKNLPHSRMAGVEAVRALENEDVSITQVEKIISTDAVLGAHLIKVANSALISYGQQTRSVGQAITRIGCERTRLHIWGLSMKRLFASPRLQKVWNHSTVAAQIGRQLAELTRVILPDEACLAALVHDIGQMVLLNLGPSYERAYAQRASSGKAPVEIECELCGLTHAAVGADLLAAWNFPADIVAGVRHHHAPGEANTPFADLLYVTEQWLDGQEDVCDLLQHRASLRRLGLTRMDLALLGTKCSPDLELLRFAA